MAFQIGDKYYHNDIESGEMVEISKGTFEALNSFMDIFKSRLSPDALRKGTIIIRSTMADDFESGEQNKNLWNDNVNFKIK
jgi:hypothetical protein